MQLLTFSLGTVKYGIPVRDVQSIEAQCAAISIPKSLPCVRGIINLHGNIVPVYSLAQRFGYPEQTIENIIITDVNEMRIGFEVCRAEEILDVPDRDIVPMPEVISATQKFITDVADYNKDLIVMLDVERLISAEEQQALQQLVEDATA